MSAQNFFVKVKEVALKRSPIDFIKEAFTYATKLVTYYIMSIDTSTVNCTNVSDIKILPTTVDDIPKLNKSSFGNHEYIKSILEQKDPLDRYFTFYNNKSQYIGYCCILLKEAEYNTFNLCNTEAYLSEFYISQEFQGQGLGTKALRDICELLKNNNMHELKLAVRNYNKPAYRCYTKVGFVYQKRFTVFLPNHSRAKPYHII